MPDTTRSSENKPADQAASEDNAAGAAKHELEDKAGPDSKKQKTIEETLASSDQAQNDSAVSQDKEEKPKNGHAENGEGDEKPSEKEDIKPTNGTAAAANDNNDDKEDTKEDIKKNGEDTEPPAAAAAAAANGDENSTAVQEGERSAVPSSILEKGIFYFFFRGRVNIEEPSNVDEIQRSYMILRPIAKDAKLGEGPIGDAGNSRLIAVPKKVLPVSGKDRWLAFVEKTDASFKTIREEFLKGEDYMTKTAGARHTPAAQPVAEGVYAITTTRRESHLAYMITLPSELGELQTALGLQEKGSFVLSTRNPAFDAPRGTALPEGPDYPKEIQNSFRTLRWQPTTPEHLDYVNAQFLLIGEPKGIENALEQQGENDGKEGGEQEEEDGGGGGGGDDDDMEEPEPLEELELLEDEDTHRMEELNGDDSAAIFADLGVHAKDYPKLETTF